MITNKHYLHIKVSVSYFAFISFYFFCDNLINMEYIQLNPFDTEPMYRQLKSSIKKAILNGVIKHNYLLPSEHQLMQVFEVSSTVVKKAYQSLEDERLIRRVRGQGTFVDYPIKITINLPLTFANNINIHFKVHNLMMSSIPSTSPVAAFFASPNKLVKIKRIIYTNDVATTYQEIFFHNHDRKVMSQYIQNKLSVKDIMFTQIPNYQKGELVSKHGIKKATAIEATFLDINVGAPLHKIASYVYDESRHLKFLVYTFIRGDIVALRFDKKL